MNTRLREQWVPCFVLATTLLVTLFATWGAERFSQAKERGRFDLEVEETQYDIQRQVKRYITLLDGVRGLVNANVYLDQQQFQTYVASLQLRQNFPGVEDVGFAWKLLPGNKSDPVQGALAGGGEPFRIWPDTGRREVYAVLRVAPLDNKTKAALGFDMLSDPVMRAAIERAIETGQPMASGMVAPASGQGAAGGRERFLICNPVYSVRTIPAAREARMEKAAGCVYCLVDAGDFLKTVSDRLDDAKITFRIYDGTVLDKTHLLHDSAHGSPVSAEAPPFTSTTSLLAAERLWSLVIAARPEFAAEAATDLAPLTLAGGTAISLLLFGMTLIQSRARTAAERLAVRMQASEAGFRASFNSAAVGNVQVDPASGQYLRVNPKFCEITGYTEEELLQKTFMDLDHPEDGAADLAAHRTMVSGEVAEINAEKRYVRKDGRVVWVNISASLIRSIEGVPDRTLAVIQDISARKQAEEKINQLNAGLEQRVAERTAQLEAANKELEAFSYSVSHDLRAPLRAVDGFSRAVEEDYGPQLPEEGRRYLHTIRQGAQRMGHLIDDLLTFSRLSRVPLTKRGIDTGALVQAVLGELAGQREGRQIDLRVGDLPACEGDPALLKQVWINLLSNAFKYTQKRESAMIEIGCTTDQERKVYFVRDNGTGFDMRYADKLFGVFQRLHRAEDYEGTGVGLAIVQRVVHRHGGQVWAEAVPDQGATFHFTLEGNHKS